MKIVIQGQDYTAALDAVRPLTIERKLNEPSVCQLWLSLPSGSSLPTPVRNQSITISGDDGTTYFTGYIATSPLPEYVGLALEGPRYRIAIQAISDELLLDQSGTASAQSAAGQTAASLLNALVTRTGVTRFSTQALTLDTPVSNFSSAPGAPWSRSAGQVANQARASYRALNSALSLASIPAAIHPLNETDGTLNLASLTLTAGAKRALANDITVCGLHEPTAYITEYFLGDGVTTQFNLSADPYFPSASQPTLMREQFTQAQIDPRLWSISATPGDFAIGAGGLAMRGGNGVDGQSLLTSLNNVEMGGTLLLEATGVAIAPNSSGILAGFFTGQQIQPDCTAGFRVTAQQGTGATNLQAIVQGVPMGASYTVNPANQYALRLRVHCPESERALATYRSSSDNGPISSTGQTNPAPARLQFEIQEFVNAVAGMPITLLDGSIGSLPETCSIVAASCIQLTGTMRSLDLVNLGSAWVVSTPSNGGPFTRRLGSAAEAAECQLDHSGKLTFFAGFTPTVGEHIAVSYRALGRSVGRAVNAASQQALAQSGLPSVSAWIGTVTSPAPRSSQDCRNAAQALAEAAASTSSLWNGEFKGTSVTFASDLWPGDALQVNAPSCNLDAQLVIRTVKLTYRNTYPDLVTYDITFANDWANDLAIHTSTAVPPDAWLPAAVSPTFLANLSNLTVTAINGASVTINTGAVAPTGGGFEIRRRDNAFMAGSDSDLVQRTAQSAITLTRATCSDRFYIRMFDAASPPNYSEFSAALILNLPLAS